MLYKGYEYLDVWSIHKSDWKVLTAHVCLTTLASIYVTVSSEL